MNISILNNPKLLDLADLLDDYLREQGFPLPPGFAETAAIGVLDRLWMFTTEYAPAGDIGRHRDRVIARAVGWSHDAGWLIETLVELRLLVRHDEHRLIVYDWSQHAETKCHQYVADHGIKFADGAATLRKPRRTSPEGIRIEDHKRRKEAADRKKVQDLLDLEREAMNERHMQERLAHTGDRIDGLPVHRLDDEETEEDRERTKASELRRREATECTEEEIAKAEEELWRKVEQAYHAKLE